MLARHDCSNARFKEEYAWKYAYTDFHRGRKRVESACFKSIANTRFSPREENEKKEEKKKGGLFEKLG